MSTAFAKLSQGIQQALWDQQWKTLRDVQVKAINQIADTSSDLIIAAATASGKTEAAFLPVLSQIDTQEQQGGISAIYIAPLKALINDQHQRLEDLCKHTCIKINRWHGDVSATEKKRVREKPEGILQITPESLESCFINYGNKIESLFKNVDFIIIDELHSFLGDVRGVHLASLISRLNSMAGSRPRLIGLSATLADFEIAKNYLNPSNPDNVYVLKDEEGSRSMSVGIRAYPKPPKNKANDTVIGEPDGITLLAEELARVFSQKTNLIFSNSRNLAELLTDHINQLSIQQKWPYNPFLIHHGSLSKETREDAEKDLKTKNRLSVFCTSTLEMGIDIGDIHSVGQLGPAWSVSSLIQRLGRSGRKEGESAILRMYALDEIVTQDSPQEHRLYPQLLRSIALIELILQKWLEPLPDRKIQISTFIQQILSILRQTGGCSAAKTHKILCEEGIFSGIEVDDFKAILRELKAHDIIEQMPDGNIILTPKGEQITHSRDFYAAFVGSEDFSIRYAGSPIGLLPSTSLPPIEGHFILNGKRWQVETIDSTSRIVDVIPSKSKKAPLFGGEGGNIDKRIFEEMLKILNSDKVYKYLHKDAKELLAKARHTFENSVTNSSFTVLSNNSTVVFPWIGTKGLLTLFLCAISAGIKVDRKQMSLTYNLSTQLLRDHYSEILSGAYSEQDLAAIIPDKHPEKYDEFAPDELIDRVNAERILAIDEAKEAAERLLTAMS